MMQDLRVLAPDNSELTDKIVQDMESQGYELVDVRTDGEYHHTAKELRDKKRGDSITRFFEIALSLGLFFGLNYMLWNVF